MMTALRPLPLSLHGAFELLFGVLALVAPFAFGFTASGTVLCALVGALAIGLALDAVDPRDVTAHHGFDIALAVGSVLVALALAVAADSAAALVLGGLGLAQLALSAGTRYSVRG
jgi:hypothetical protein